MPDTLKKAVIILFLFLLVNFNIISQEIDKNKEEEFSGYLTDFNKHYRFPFSLGFQYQLHSPQGWFKENPGAEFTLNDIVLYGYVPIPPKPIFQPLLKAGVIIATCTDRLLEDQYKHLNHTRIYFEGGMGIYHKFNKQFEVGGEISSGFAYNYYPDYDIINKDPAQSWSWMSDLGIRGAYNFNYNFSLNAHLSLRYNLALKEYYDHFFDGFSIGIGAMVTYRFGRDPDAPEGQMRYLKFKDTRIKPIFAAMQSYYVNHSIGEITLMNNEEFPLLDLEVSFFQKNFMDGRTELKKIPVLPPKQSITVPISASFNQNVFNTEGTTPLTGEIRIDYKAEGHSGYQIQTVNYDLYDKESITWDDDRKAAAFITASDSVVRAYTSQAGQSSKDAVNPGYSKEIQSAIQLFYSLKEMGLLYQRDPASPFDAAKKDPMVVDAVSIPRKTLQRLSGDCDDISVLFCSLLEASGVQTALVTIPGHIYMGFNTKKTSREYMDIHPDPEMTLNWEGQLWVLLETTLIGRSSFMEAWQTGMQQFKKYESNPKQRQLYIVQEAQKTYRPIPLAEQNIALPEIDASLVLASFKKSMDSIVDNILKGYQDIARERGNKGAYNALGITASKLGRYQKAENAYNQALALDRNYLSARLNLANTYILMKQYVNAIRLFSQLETALQTAGAASSKAFAETMLGLSKAYYAIEDYDKALDYYDRLTISDQKLAADHAYLKRRK